MNLDDLTQLNVRATTLVNGLASPNNENLEHFALAMEAYAAAARAPNRASVAAKLMDAQGLLAQIVDNLSFGN